MCEKTRTAETPPKVKTPRNGRRSRRSSCGGLRSVEEYIVGDRHRHHIQPAAPILAMVFEPSLLSSVSISMLTSIWLNPGLIVSLPLVLATEFIRSKASRLIISSWLIAVSLARGASAWRDGLNGEAGWVRGWKNRRSDCCRGSTVSAEVGSESMSSSQLSIGASFCCFWAENIQRSVFAALSQLWNDVETGHQTGLLV